MPGLESLHGCLRKNNPLRAELQVSLELKESRRYAEQIKAELERVQKAHRELLSSHATELLSVKAALKQQKDANGELSLEKLKVQGELIDCLKLLRQHDENLGILRRDLADSEFEVDQLRIAFRCASEYSLQLEADKRAAESVVEHLCAELSHAAATATAVTEAAVRAAAAAASAAAAAAGPASCHSSPARSESGSQQLEREEEEEDEGGASGEVLAPAGSGSGGCSVGPSHDDAAADLPELLRPLSAGGAGCTTARVSCGADGGDVCAGCSEWRSSSSGGSGPTAPGRCCNSEAPAPHRPDSDTLEPRDCASGAPGPVPAASNACGQSSDTLHGRTNRRSGKRRVDLSECRAAKGAMAAAASHTAEAVAGLEAAVAQLRAVCQELHRVVAAADSEAAAAPAALTAAARGQARSAAAAAAAAAAMGGAALGAAMGGPWPRPLLLGECGPGGSPPCPPATPPRPVPAVLAYFSNLVTPKPRRTGGEAAPGCGETCGGCLGRGTSGAAGAAWGAGGGPLSVRVEDVWRGAPGYHAGGPRSPPGAVSPAAAMAAAAASLPPTPTPTGLGLSEALSGWASGGSGDAVRSAVVVQGRPMAMGAAAAAAGATRGVPAAGSGSPPSPVSSLLPPPARGGSSSQVLPAAAAPAAAPAAASRSADSTQEDTRSSSPLRASRAGCGPGSPHASPAPGHTLTVSQGAEGGTSGGRAGTHDVLDMEVVSLRLTNEALQRQVAELQRQNDLLQLRQLSTTTTTPAATCHATTTATTTSTTTCHGGSGTLLGMPPCGSPAAPLRGPGMGAGPTGGCSSQSRLAVVGLPAPSAAAAAAAAASTCSLPAAAAFYYGSLPPGRAQTGEPLYSGPHHAAGTPRGATESPRGPGGGGGVTGGRCPAVPPPKRVGADGVRSAGGSCGGGGGGGGQMGTQTASDTLRPPEGLNQLQLHLPGSPPSSPGGCQPAAAGSPACRVEVRAPGLTGASASPGQSRRGALPSPGRPPVTCSAAAAFKVLAAEGPDREPTVSGPPGGAPAKGQDDRPQALQVAAAAPLVVASAEPAPVAQATAPQLAAAVALPPPGMDSALWELELLVACSKGSALPS